MSGQNSGEYAGDSFEDVSEAPESLNISIPKSSSARSLTDSPPIGSGASPQTPEKSFPPTGSQDEHKDEIGAHADSPERLRIQAESNEDMHEADAIESHAPVDLEAPDSNAEHVRIDTSEVADDKDDENHAVTPVEGGDAGDAEETPRRNVAQKSPLLTSHRLSTTSSLDEVNLTSTKDNEDLSPQAVLAAPVASESPPVPPKDDVVASPPSSGLMGSLPSLPWSAPPTNKAQPAIPPPPPPTRKPSGPFAWFSRSSTSSKDVKSPPANGRRNTSTSVSTVASNLDLVEGDGSSVHSRRPRRNSLKDQFKILRMREESALPENDESSVRSGQGSLGHSVASPPMIPEEGQDGGMPVPPAASGATSPGSFSPSTVNPGLAPGTVSGFSQSATDAAAPVDWDLWQQLVNNGPSALASSEELNAAIKRGIPQTIRGVIWQILADCRGGELEEIYRDLVSRGTEKDSRTPSVQINGVNEKESVTSSRSSVRSNTSGSGGQPTSTVTSPSQEIDPERMAREQAAAETARLKKAKDDASALSKLEKTIRRDLGARTSYSKYFVSQGSQESLFGLCKAYALYDEAVGYAQGMNFIVMPLLFNMDEADAFELLVKLMNKYRLREMFISDMPGLHRSLFQFERLLEDLEPALYCHLRRRGVPPQLYATQWFLTLFAYRFPLQLVLRIYDLIFEEGLEITLLKFSIAIMRRNTEALLEMKDMSALTTFLKERLFDAYIDKQPSASSILESGFFGSSGAADKEVYRAELLVEDACAVPLTQETIKSYTAEWEEKVFSEKEREAELENLRHTVSAQATRLRLLEERSEASDKEHVQLASELVHAKVENEELRDMNDALKLQVEQLKNVVDKQPGEVEEKLRTEMDRIMQRNIEVQNENRSMEESMAEMEKELVATKMKWAEISEEHETLRQKWSDLRRALD
ncbi:hypothetical protein N7539_004580 [Penicillium diatomitis]|uniref:GTPase-activating protein GYP5 n=1 Tax=Penicillium diatomitis TaxID=2819901 RepID=A0A9W9XE31_9EURO|nr:uncharacterized protein N7539_004580 [Penicillium diatomitis]KAJ5489690.1 hypothetical protein N7539_004580 [Penicillium diatomitis]